MTNDEDCILFKILQRLYCKIFKIFENEKIIDALYNNDPIFTKYIEFKYLNYKSTKILIFEIKDMSEFEKLLTHN